MHSSKYRLDHIKIKCLKVKSKVLTDDWFCLLVCCVCWCFRMVQSNKWSYSYPAHEIQPNKILITSGEKINTTDHQKQLWNPKIGWYSKINRLKQKNLQRENCPIDKKYLKSSIRLKNSQYLHEWTNHETDALRIHNLDLDQMSKSDNSESKQRTPRDMTCKASKNKKYEFIKLLSKKILNKKISQEKIN